MDQASDSTKRNVMTVDVEDYFQVSAFEHAINPADWDAIECRVEANIDKLLQMFAEHNAKATFFTLGYIAQRYPQLIKRIVEQGHELASHGFMHKRATDQSRSEFKQDIGSAKRLLEDLTGQSVIGYRAPSFSFNDHNPWVYDVLAEEGYQYSSSVYPVKHDHYGIPDAPRFKYKTDSGVDEIPLSTLPIMGKNIPISGGGFFRLYPYALTRWAIKRHSVNETQPYIFYLHPWEVDPQQPRVDGVSAKSRFRHYLNLNKVEGRLNGLLEDFEWSTMACEYGYK